MKILGSKVLYFQEIKFNCDKIKFWIYKPNTILENLAFLLTCSISLHLDVIIFCSFIFNCFTSSLKLTFISSTLEPKVKALIHFWISNQQI